MSQAAAAEFIPLESDSQGVLRIVGTSVTLDAVVAVYRAGHTAEEIARHYSSLQLADVYAVLTYYLRHQLEVDNYIRRRQSFPGTNRVGGLAAERSELLARKHGGEDLSPGEQERLEILTARLKEALPPISPGELEVLLEMTKEVESIRERARERRQRLGLG
jgi:uncharacterized protein (DUF433 family)